MDKSTAKLQRSFDRRNLKYARQICEIHKLDAEGAFMTVAQPRLDPSAYLLNAFDLKH